MFRRRILDRILALDPERDDQEIYRLSATYEFPFDTTRSLELVAIGSSVRGTLALNRTARAWALLHQRRYVTPDDFERLFVPVLLHRILFRQSFLAEIRDRGWEAAAQEVRARCLEIAPKPGFDIDLDVPAAAGA